MIKKVTFVDDGTIANNFKRIIARQDLIFGLRLTCPKCGSDQVQIMTNFLDVPAQWRCRMCKHKFEYEPTSQP